jgi:hypothetical protein
MHFVYIFRSSSVEGIEHCAHYERGSSKTDVYGVTSNEKAGELAKRLAKEGVDTIELCGAFGEAGKQTVVDIAACEMPVGHVVYTASEEAKHDRLFKR